MFRSLYLFLLLLLMLGLTSCRTNRTIISSSGGEPDVQAYISKYKDLAISEMNRAGIPASITLAQGMIESDYGRSTLAREGNNHFGIKCHNDWNGPTFRHHDNRRNECFRKYSRPEASFRDHSDFLRTGSRYSFLFDLSPTDYKGWARGLKKAGYATNPDYANMLIRKIEENNLYYFDKKYPIKEVPGYQVATAAPVRSEPVNEYPEQAPPVINDNFKVTSHVRRVMENNRIQYIIVKDGETADMIEKEFQLLKWELQKYNELGNDFTPVAGQILYLQPKRDKAEIGKEIHTLMKGDTMYSVSQKYGVKLKKLYEYNRMAEGEEPVEGQEIWLRSTKPAN